MKSILKNIGFIGLVLSIFAVSGFAQISEKKSLTLEGAREVISAAKDYARKNNAPGGVIAVVDDGGNLIALERLGRNFFCRSKYFNRQGKNCRDVQTSDQSF